MSIEASEIVVAAGDQRSEIIRVDHRPGAGERHSLRVFLEPGSTLNLQELRSGSGAYEVSLQVRIELQAGARMRHVAVVDDNGDGRFEIDRQISLDSEAQLNYTRVGSGAASDREVVRTCMNGARSCFRHGALMLVEPGRQAELDLEIAHNARHADSESLCRCILDANGNGQFAGKILIAPDGQGADARLRNDNLLLDESAHMETRPELEVYADEVQCAHGAATGALDEEALFYLKTRGLSPIHARAMLVRAFASKISNTIELADAGNMAGAMLERALGETAQRLAA